MDIDSTDLYRTEERRQWGVRGTQTTSEPLGTHGVSLASNRSSSGSWIGATSWRLSRVISWVFGPVGEECTEVGGVYRARGITRSLLACIFAFRGSLSLHARHQDDRASGQ
jgi:hypothetical protein